MLQKHIKQISKLLLSYLRTSLKHAYTRDRLLWEQEQAYMVVVMASDNSFLQIVKEVENLRNLEIGGGERTVIKRNVRPLI